MPVDDFIQEQSSEAGKIATLNIALPTDADFNREAQRQRSTMGAAFDEVHNAASNTASTTNLINRQNEEIRKLNKIGIQPVTVVNLMPFALNVNGAIHQRYDLKVPQAPIEDIKNGKDYAFRTFDHAYWDYADLGSGMDGVDNYIPKAWLPQEVAEDFIREFVEIQRCGGVFMFQGTGEPKGPGLEKVLKDAREGRNRWAQERVAAANLEYTNPTGAGKKNITDIDRFAAKILITAKIIKAEQAPYLLDIRSSTGQAPEMCKGCGQPKGLGAVCVNCGNVFNPVLAYKEGMIAYGHVSFDKLNAEGWTQVKAIKKERDKLRAE